MAFVHVILADGETQRLQEAHAGDAQYHFLFEAIHLIPAIQKTGELAIVFAVLVQIGVEQDDRFRAVVGEAAHQI